VGLFSFQYRVANVCVLINDYILIEPAREYRTEVRVCPSGKSVGPKFPSSNGVLAHSRIAEGYASIRELIASVSTSAFVRTYLPRTPAANS
jgi:hypothetical protein